MELTVEEMQEAARMGLAVTKCVSCGHPTLYSNLITPPRTCGRAECMESAHERLRYRRRE